MPKISKNDREQSWSGSASTNCSVWGFPVMYYFQKFEKTEF